jgi:peptide/nickel transport system substrate-binding protein
MIEQAPKTLDPIHATDAYGVRISHQLIFETLVTLGDDLQIAPGVAASWERPAPTRLRLKLRPGNRFADGSRLDAADVVFTLESLIAPETGSPYGPGLREKIAHVKAGDPATVEIELSAPYAAILHDLIVPVRSRNAGAEQPLLGSGPFRLLEQQPSAIVLGRNDAYAGPRPNSARVLFKVVSDENTRILKLRKGDIDLAVNAVPVDKLALFDKPPLNGRYTVLSAPGLSYQYLGFNLDDPMLRDVRVRRAIAHAIDVETLIRYRQFGHSTRATGLLLDSNPYALPGLTPPAHDPALAAKLLDEAGYPLKDGRRFALSYKTSTDRAAVIQARAVQNDLKQVGIEVDVRSFEWGTFYADVQNGNFQLFSLRWVGVSDPDFFYELFHSSRLPPEGRNRVRYRNAELDKLLEQGRITTDPAQRREIYFSVQRTLAADLPYLSLWHNDNVAVVSNRVSGFRLHPTGGFQHLAEAVKAGK